MASYTTWMRKDLVGGHFAGTGRAVARRPRNEVYFRPRILVEELRTTAEAKFVNAREELNFGGPEFRH